MYERAPQCTRRDQSTALGASSLIPKESQGLSSCMHSRCFYLLSQLSGLPWPLYGWGPQTALGCLSQTAKLSQRSIGPLQLHQASLGVCCSTQVSALYWSKSPVIRWRLRTVFVLGEQLLNHELETPGDLFEMKQSASRMTSSRADVQYEQFWLCLGRFLWSGKRFGLLW